MTIVKKIPQRQCVGCGEKKAKKELIRIVKPQDGNAFLDPSGKKNGRGAYICNNLACLEQAKKKKALERTLKTQIDEETYELLKKELEQIETR